MLLKQTKILKPFLLLIIKIASRFVCVRTQFWSLRLFRLAGAQVTGCLFGFGTRSSRKSQQSRFRLRISNFHSHCNAEHCSVTELHSESLTVCQDFLFCQRLLVYGVSARVRADFVWVQKNWQQPFRNETRQFRVAWCKV